MPRYIDFARKKNCWNLHEATYTCIGCGCCSKDKKLRYQNRVRVLKRQLKSQYDFNDWVDDPELKAIQERNVKANIRYFKKKLRYYENRLLSMGGGKDDAEIH